MSTEALALFLIEVDPPDLDDRAQGRPLLQIRVVDTKLRLDEGGGVGGSTPERRRDLDLEGTALVIHGHRSLEVREQEGLQSGFEIVDGLEGRGEGLC